MTLVNGPTALAVVRLSVSDFRCYPTLRMEVAPQPVVLTGANGAGKTNILEALSFLAPGRGLRRARLADVARREAAPRTTPGASWAVAATIRHGDALIELGTGRDGQSERRLVRIDGKKARSQAMLGEWVSILWLVPSMDRLFTDSAGGRRRFLDRLVLGFDPAHAGRAAIYDHSLRQRGRLLQEGTRDKAWLDGLEKTMAESGIQLAAARRQVIDALNAACAEGTGPFPTAELQLEGKIDDKLAEFGIEAAGRWLRDALAANRESAESAIGPHRSDFLVRHRDKDLPAPYCSTGEQKALLLSILLAQARVQTSLRGMAPILLLDEVAAHLDEVRRKALWDELDALGLQCWMTGTDRSLFEDLDGRGQFFDVADGHVTPFLQ